MITNANIEEIIKKVKDELNQQVTLRDVMFILNQGMFEDRKTAYKASFGEVISDDDLDVYIYSERIQCLIDLLKPFMGGNLEDGAISEDDITFEENKQGLIKLLNQITKAKADGIMDTKDAFKLETDIRVKLNDKFDTAESTENKHIIVVPSKHDIICPHTNYECTFMPTKEACMKYYNIKDNK